jgi:hypothetical protein
LPPVPRFLGLETFKSSPTIKGANGCGSNHNLLWLDHSLHFDLPSWHAPPPRLVFDRIAFQKKEVQKEYQDQLSPLLENWNLKVRPILESPLFLLLPPALRSAIMDGFYQKWTFLFYQAKCHSVPIKSISPYSCIYINEEHKALVAKRVEGHTKLKQYVDLCSGGRGLLSGINLESDPIWRELWNMYAQLRNEVASLAVSLKTERWLKFLEKIDNDAEADHRHFYSSIAKVRGTKVDSSLRTLYTSPPSETNPTPATTSNPEKIKDILRDFFEKQAESHTSTDPRFDQNFFATVHQEVTAVCPNAVGPEELEKPLTLDEVTEAIGQAQNNKAPGQDSVFNESMKYGGEAAVHSCFFLFTHLFENGICPRAWSKALIHLIFKGGDKDPLSCSSYRPISLISIVSKIYEWIF